MRRTLVLLPLFILLAVTAGARDDFRYALVEADHNTITGHIDVSRIHELQRWPGAYLWAQFDGRQYVIRDKTVLAEARAAFREADVLHDEYERLTARMRPLDRKQDALEDQIDEISDRDDEDLTAADEDKLADLRKQLKAVEKQLRVLEAEEERLDEREEVLTAVAEKKLRGIIDRAVDRGLAERVR